MCAFRCTLHNPFQHSHTSPYDTIIYLRPAVGIMQSGGSSLWHSSPLNLRPFYIAQNIAKQNATSRSTRLLIQKQLNESNQSPGTRCVTNDGSKYIEDNLKPSNHSLNASVVRQWHL
eukprot:304387_1